MKLSVYIRGEVIAVPCGKGTESVKVLGVTAVKRYSKLRPASSATAEHIQEIRRKQSGAILDPDDPVRDVLDDNDTVTIVFDDVNGSEGGYNPLEREEWTAPQYQTEQYLSLNGNSLSTEDVMELGKGNYKIKLCPIAERKVMKARELIDNIIKENKVAYGINTGFGKFARVVIPKEQLRQFISYLTSIRYAKAAIILWQGNPHDGISELQENLIRSHASGVGNPLNPERVRRFMSLRINVLAKGFSGISLAVLQQFIAAFNASCLPWIPEKGTVGASGDLAPLSHMALGLMGEGRMWSPQTGWDDAKKVLDVHKLKPIKLGPKEGLALINGTQFITSLGVEALERANDICDTANVVAALSLEVLKGSTRAFDEDVHATRPHKGQIKIARNLRALLHSEVYRSEIAESHRFCDRVQDAYTLRCCPQVHGIVSDTIDFARSVLSVEVNSGTDNPMVFADRGEIISGGNFHGEYPAKVLDYLSIGVHELASMSERRIERLVNPAYSELPAFLVDNGGQNSGFMIAHCTAAALVSENKVLCHPSSVDSLSTSAGTEDHVSMGGWSARKAIMVVENVEQVLAIELLAACQAIEFLRPMKTTEPLEEVYALVRSVAKKWDKDRYMSPDIEAVTKLIRSSKIWQTAKPHIDRVTELATRDLAIDSPTSFSVHDFSEAPATKRKRAKY